MEIILILLLIYLVYRFWKSTEPKNDIVIYTEKLPGKPMHNENEGFKNLPKFVRVKAFDDNAPTIFGKVRNFNVIDFETANNLPDSVCQLGITVVKDNKVVDTLSFYVKPPYHVFTNSHIHGITEKTVANAPNFGQLWPEVKQYFEGQIIAAYNLSFDAGCLESLFKCYGIHGVSYAAFDILKTARHMWPDLKNHKLITVANYFDIPLNAHDAGSDVRAAALIQIAANANKDGYTSVVCQRGTLALLDKFKFELLYDTKAYEEAVRLIELNKDSTNIADYEKSIALLDKAIVTSENTNHTAKAHRSLGELYEKCNMIDGAISNYKKALFFNEKVGVKIKLEKLLKIAEK